ncbi:unnamed protein product [Candidula unifasciata]|uniref:Uncharacterized protein n=1 Tax=Candidula unifasciata TaxID=100452 RepID=A0A8S3Z5E8_9EUPU|nr:unnamed protein product [Candidula unifasciata]
MITPLAISIISLASFYLSCGLCDQICVQWPDYGIRRHNYCFVDLKKSFNSQVFLYEEALSYCHENGGIVNNSALTPADFEVLSRAEGNVSGVNAVRRFSGRRSRTREASCSRRLTTRPGCKVVCAFESCPVGTFGFPECQPCLCKNADRCDIITGLCMETNCTPGFFGPPACRKCNCQLGTLCNEETGECPLGCRKGWGGKSCQERGCREGRCPRLTIPDETNCTAGSDCTKRSCPQGFYNPPTCNETCYCLYSEFCDGIDGDCGGTPCIGRRSGRRCEDADCPIMHFGVPDCSNFCFCKDNQPCHTRKGTCLAGCRQGWSGETCNQRFCPAGRFGYPACNLLCNCKRQDACNSLSGLCELHGCSDGRELVKNCTKQVPRAPEGVVSSAYSTFSAFALVFGTLVVIVAICVQSMTHTPDPMYSRRSTMATSGAPSSDSMSTLTTQRKSRVSYIQMDNRHLSVSLREPIFTNSSHATAGLSTSNGPALFPSSCVDTKQITTV